MYYGCINIYICHYRLVRTYVLEALSSANVTATDFCTKVLFLIIQLKYNNVDTKRIHFGT